MLELSVRLLLDVCGTSYATYKNNDISKSEGKNTAGAYLKKHASHCYSVLKLPHLFSGN